MDVWWKYSPRFDDIHTYAVGFGLGRLHIEYTGREITALTDLLAVNTSSYIVNVDRYADKYQPENNTPAMAHYIWPIMGREKEGLDTYP